MRRTLSTKVPPLHGTLITLTLGDRLNIDELTDLEMSGAQAIANREEILWGHHELGQVSLWREVEFEKMTSLRLPQILHSFLANTNLNGIDAVLLESFDLSDLASINLNDGAWDDLSPFVPKVCHSHFIPKETHSLAISVSSGSFHKLELLVDLVLKAGESEILIGNSMHSILCDGSIIKNFSLREVLPSESMQLGDAYIC